MNNIYYSSVLPYFKLSKVRMKKSSKYFTSNATVSAMTTLSDMINCQHRGYIHAFLHENIDHRVLLFLC